jgi:hypothetical protein
LESRLRKRQACSKKQAREEDESWLHCIVLMGYVVAR